MHPGAFYTPDDFTNPAFCVGCGAHVPKSVLSAQGLCPLCLATHRLPAPHVAGPPRKPLSPWQITWSILGLIAFCAFGFVAAYNAGRPPTIGVATEPYSSQPAPSRRSTPPPSPSEAQELANQAVQRPEPTVREQPQETERVGRVVYVTRTGEKYHKGGCRYLRQSRIPMEEDRALAAGYDPCSVCGG